MQTITIFTTHLKHVREALFFVSASLAPNATLDDVQTDSLTIDVAGNSKNTFDSYCVKMVNKQLCLTNGTRDSDVLNMTGLTNGTSYTFHVYTVWQGVLSEHYTTIQSFTSKNSFYNETYTILYYQHIHGKYMSI